MKEKMTIDEASTYWNKTRRTIERWMKSGKLLYGTDPGGKRFVLWGVDKENIEEIKKKYGMV